MSSPKAFIVEQWKFCNALTLFKANCCLKVHNVPLKITIDNFGIRFFIKFLKVHESCDGRYFTSLHSAMKHLHPEVTSN